MRHSMEAGRALKVVEGRKEGERKGRLSRRRGSLFLVLILFGVMAFTFGPQYYKWRDLQAEMERLQQEKDRLVLQQSQLLEEIQLLQTDAYIESMARKELGLVKPGETMVMWGTPGDIRPLQKGPIYEEPIKD